jgi:hypothetical protein
MYKLIRIYDVESNDNEVISAKYDVLSELSKFDYGISTERELIDICKSKDMPDINEGCIYSIVCYKSDIPIAVEGQLFYHTEDDSFLDIAEYNARIVTSVALGYDLVISKKYALINEVSCKGFMPWIEEVVTYVVNNSGIECSEVVIADVEETYERIHILIDKKNFIIRMNNFQPIKKDDSGNICTESVNYTLYKIIDGDSHSLRDEKVSDGTLCISWKNK